MAKNEGGQAFPRMTKVGEVVQSDFGMSMRQYYKAMALQGLLASGLWSHSLAAIPVACVLADAMIAEDIEAETT